MIIRDDTQCLDCEDIVDEEEIEFSEEDSEMEENLEEVNNNASSETWKQKVNDVFKESNDDNEPAENKRQENKTIVTDSINNQ